jgi:preprotein translocase subunit SecF
MQFFTDSHFRFMRYRKAWAVVSTLLSLLAVFAVFVHGKLNVGIDFAGGTQLIVQFRETVDPQDLRRALAREGLGDVSIQRFGEEGSGEFMLRTPIKEGGEEGGRGQEVLAALDRVYNPEQAGGFDLNQRGAEPLAELLLAADPEVLAANDADLARAHYAEIAEAILDARRDLGIFASFEQVTGIEAVGPEVAAALQERAYLGDFSLLGQEVVGPTVGAELRRKGILAVVLSVFAMLAYIWVRFELRFGIGAVVATIHDVLVVLGLYAILDFEFNLTTIAAFLTLVGYSVNDTVVVFDRVRENLQQMRRKSFEEVIDLSINQTLSRTILTSGTTLVAVASLLAFGGEVLRGFAFVMTVGVVVGTYSSIWVASAFTLMWENMMQRRGRGSAAPAGGGRAVDGETPPRKVAAGGRRRG